MSFIQCPECGSRISERATSCPYCGFMSEDRSRPISEQDSYELVPSFEVDIEEWKPNATPLSVLSVKDNKALVQYFGRWQNVLRMQPIAKVIRAMAKKDNVLVADMDSYVKGLIEKGIYRFTIDKNGHILPTIRDGKGIVKQVRLKEMSFTPELANSLQNLTMQAAMAQILDEIEYVGDTIRGIHLELQNDRLAMAESARDKLLLATKIQDSRIRETAILNAVESATEAKRVLMRNFSENLRFLRVNSDKSDVELIFEGKRGRDISQKAEDSFQALVAVINVVQAECQGYALLGEYGSSKESLIQFKSFIVENRLDDRDTLLLLNESTPQREMPVVDGFIQISDRITNLDKNVSLTDRKSLKLVEADVNEVEE